LTFYNILVIKSRRLRWAGHVALTGEKKKNAYRLLMEQSESNKLEDLDVDGREVLN
jgi:hypothetical protein